jgi:hypothetical protein
MRLAAMEAEVLEEVLKMMEPVQKMSEEAVVLSCNEK